MAGPSRGGGEEALRRAAPPLSPPPSPPPGWNPGPHLRPKPGRRKSPPPAPRGVVLRQLSDEEKARRAAALADARVSDSEARKIAEADARRRAEEEEKLKIERLAAEKRKAEEEARKAADELAKKRAEQEAARRLETTPKPGEVAATDAPRRRLENEEEEMSARRARPASRRSQGARSQEGRRR